MIKRCSLIHKATMYFVREGIVSKWWHPKLHEYSIQLLNLLAPHEGDLVLGDIQHVPFKPEAFDKVFCQNFTSRSRLCEGHIGN